MTEQSTTPSTPDAFGIAILGQEKLAYVEITISWQNLSVEDLLKHVARYPGHRLGIFPLWKHDGSYTEAFLSIYDGPHTARTTISFSKTDPTPDIHEGETFYVTDYDPLNSRITIKLDDPGYLVFTLTEEQFFETFFSAKIVKNTVSP